MFVYLNKKAMVVNTDEILFIERMLDSLGYHFYGLDNEAYYRVLFKNQQMTTICKTDFECLKEALISHHANLESE